MTPIDVPPGYALVKLSDLHALMGEAAEPTRVRVILGHQQVYERVLDPRLSFNYVDVYGDGRLRFEIFKMGA